MATHSARADQFTPQALYAVMVSALAPRPIALVSTLSASGELNVAPYSFITPGGTQPASLAFSVTLNAEADRKNTLLNIERSGEYVVNMATAGLLRAYADPGQSDQIKSEKAQCIDGLRLTQSPVSFECKLFRTLPHGDAPGSAVYVVGEIVFVHVRESISAQISETSRGAGLVSRLGGLDYLDLDSLELLKFE